MNSLLLGVLRHALTLAGGVLVARGYADDGMVQEGVGAVMSLGSIAWSAYEKRRNAGVLAEAQQIVAAVNVPGPPL